MWFNGTLEPMARFLQEYARRVEECGHDDFMLVYPEVRACVRVVCVVVCDCVSVCGMCVEHLCVWLCVCRARTRVCVCVNQ